MQERLLAKLLSGRFLLTLVAGLVFVYATYEGILEAQAISAILAMVFQAYFMKNRKEQQ